MWDLRDRNKCWLVFTAKRTRVYFDLIKRNLMLYLFIYLNNFLVTIVRVVTIIDYKSLRQATQIFNTNTIIVHRQ